jgi:hypothetical protein
MKKAVASPLCSAFLIPGFGQLLNQEVKKGGTLLAAVLVLAILGAVNLISLVNAAPEALQTRSFTPLWVLLALFACIWIYSVLDAYLVGRKMDLAEESNPS